MDYMITTNAKKVAKKSEMPQEIVLNTSNDMVEEQPEEVKQIKELPLEKIVEKMPDNPEEIKLDLPELTLAQSDVSVTPIELDKLKFKQPKQVQPKKMVKNIKRVEVSYKEPVYESIDSTLALKKVEPRYPRRAKKRGIEGHVDISFKIRPNGEVFDMKITNSKPAGVFDRAALKALKRWKFSTFSKDKKYKISSATFNFGINR